MTVTYPEKRNCGVAVGQLGVAVLDAVLLAGWRAVIRNPLRRRSSPSAMSAVRAWATCRAARLGLTGSIASTIAGAAARTEAGRGSRASTSTRGHSAIQ